MTPYSVFPIYKVPFCNNIWYLGEKSDCNWLWKKNTGIGSQGMCSQRYNVTFVSDGVREVVENPNSFFPSGRCGCWKNVSMIKSRINAVKQGAIVLSSTQTRPSVKSFCRCIPQLITSVFTWHEMMLYSATQKGNIFWSSIVWIETIASNSTKHAQWLWYLFFLVFRFCIFFFFFFLKRRWYRPSRCELQTSERKHHWNGEKLINSCRRKVHTN